MRRERTIPPNRTAKERSKTRKEDCMKNIRSSNFRRVMWARGSRLRKMLLLTALGAVGIALATPPLGFIVNQILAKGVITSNINENVQITRDQDGTVNPWGAEVQAHGATDFYMQHLVLAPGG